MTARVLITGSSGLVGRALAAALGARGVGVAHLDLRAPSGSGRGDVRDLDDVRRAVRGCTGVVHLAAVSRVVWAERDPALCRATNVVGTRSVLDAALACPQRPWVVFASSREVYGEPARLPATEETPLAPVNVYGRSKLAGERLMEDARAAGLRTAVVRLSNVYGDARDHADRVVPAFARAAAAGGVLRVDGGESTFDFTHLDDAARGLGALAELLDGGGAAPLPPVQLVTGTPTTLAALAALAVELAGRPARIVEAPPRPFDVARFYGSLARARALLGWTPQVALRDGLARLIDAFRAPRALPSGQAQRGDR